VRIALQIFRKDIERLWWVVLLTVALLALFAWQDINRAISPDGNWLNLALPFAWSLLIALVINQDPLTGDRQFWVSLPCGWQPLLAAKTAFIAAFIQLPYFLATAAILLAKGFNPLEHIPHLFWKQLVLLAFILPAVAVAAAVKNVAHFLLVVITIGGSVILTSGRLNFANGQDTSWDVRWDLTLLILVIGALIVASLQFARRYTLHARAIGVAAAVAAFSLYNWLPRDASAAIRAAFSPAAVGAPITVTIGSRIPTTAEQRRYYNNRRTTILLPIEFSRLVSNSNTHLDQISLELTSASGERYEAQWPHSPNDVQRQRIIATLGPWFQTLELYNAEISKRLLSGPVTIKGRILARFYQPGQSTTLRTSGRTEIVGPVHCVIARRDAVFPFPSIECDSAELASGEMLLDGRLILREDGIFGGLSRYPKDPWLSPVHKAMAVIQPRATPTIAPTSSLGSAVIDYTFPNVDLNRYIVSEVRQ
jgi:hypothetical protein